MRQVCRAAASMTLLVTMTSVTLLLAQEPNQTERIRVFLDCQPSGCDFDLVRREITWVDWVRNREDADVHLLVVSAETGAGAMFDIRFIGRGDFEGDDASLTHSSSSTDTEDERRRGLMERFRLGLARYASGTPAAESPSAPVGFGPGDSQ